MFIPSYYYKPDDVGNPEYQEPKPICECGAEVCGSPGHAQWCPVVEWKNREKGETNA